MQGHQVHKISIHAPREGCDATQYGDMNGEKRFQSTHPARGATLIHLFGRQAHLFQSTHPARGATFAVEALQIMPEISIHAPREGCDHLVDGLLHITGISIHAPREGCDGRPALGRPYSRSHFNPRTPRGVRRGSVFLLSSSGLFQSTHPARGATPGLPGLCSRVPDFNPRTPRGVRPRGCARGRARQINFNPRTPRGVRRLVALHDGQRLGISIHAPREGCDAAGLGYDILPDLFQSTHPARGATKGVVRRMNQGNISIHAPREGCDRSSSSVLSWSAVFQSTHPARGATIGGAVKADAG